MALQPLDSICKLISSGGTPSRKNSLYFTEGAPGHPWVKSKELLDGAVSRTEELISDDGLKNSSAKYYPENTILVAMYGANVGQLGWIRMPATVNQAICALVVDDEIADWRFVFYSLLLNRADLTIQAQGAAQQNLNQDLIRQFSLDLPLLPIQRRIAGILSAYDDLIENSQRRIKILEEMARRLYREWFVHFRFPGHEDCRFVDSPLGEIPEGWEAVTIDEVCSRVTDGSHRSPRSVNEGMPMASSKDMHDWGLNLDTVRLISPEDFAELVRNDCKPQKNDVLITKDGANYLKHIFVARAEQEVVLLSSVAMLRPSARINPHLLVATLKEPENKDKLKNYVTGAAIPRVILKDFKRFQLLLPGNEVQTAWAKIAEPMTEQIWRLIDKIHNLRRTRDLLLPRLLSGQIDVEALPVLFAEGKGSCSD